MGLTLGEAAVTCGKSKTALSKAIKGGRLTAPKLENGAYDIDPAELDRWVNHVARKPKSKPQKVTVDNTDLIIEVNTLKAQLGAAESERDVWKNQASDLKLERDKWQQQAQMLLLTSGVRLHPWWKRLLGIAPQPTGST